MTKAAMKSRPVGISLIALLGAMGAGGAFAHEPQEAGMTHWLEHQAQPMPGASGPKRAAPEPIDKAAYLPAEADSTRWLAKLPAGTVARGAAGPLRTGPYLPEYMLPAEADSTRWLEELK